MMWRVDILAWLGSQDLKRRSSHAGSAEPCCIWWANLDKAV